VALPSGTVVLHIGDSFAGALGLDLNRKLEAAGNRGILKYRTASYIPGWASGKELQKYISDFHPDLVLVTLGANELGIGAPEQRAHAIHKLVNTIGDVPCVWIGPALWPGAHTQLLKVVEDNCAPCRYLDSTAFLPNLARAKDGIHPSTAAREEWAQFVVQWLTTHRDPQGPKVWSLLSAD
jgi:lysophospholipase L1-like esterase